MRDDFHFVELAVYLIAVGVALPAIALLKSHHEMLAATITAWLLLPFPLYLLRLRVELYSWLESFVIFHLQASWVGALIGVALALLARFVT